MMNVISEYDHEDSFGKSGSEMGPIYYESNMINDGEILGIF